MYGVPRFFLLMVVHFWAQSPNCQLKTVLRHDNSVSKATGEKPDSDSNMPNIEFRPEPVSLLSYCASVIAEILALLMLGYIYVIASL